MGGIIMAFCVTGVFSIASNPFDVMVTLLFGLIGYIFYKFDVPSAPLSSAWSSARWRRATSGRRWLLVKARIRSCGPVRSPQLCWLFR